MASFPLTANKAYFPRRRCWRCKGAAEAGIAVLLEVVLVVDATITQDTTKKSWTKHFKKTLYARSRDTIYKLRGSLPTDYLLLLSHLG